MEDQTGTTPADKKEDKKKTKTDKANVTVNVFDANYDFCIQSSSTGRSLFDQVIKLLDIKDVWFFGLQFTDPKGFPAWIKLKKKVFSQDVGKKRPVQIQFRAKFFPEDVDKEMVEPSTIRVFFEQVQESVLSGEIYCPPDTAVLLASYAAQANLGDYKEDIHKPGFLLAQGSVLPERVFAKYELSPPEWEDKIVSFYKDNKGLPRTKAMLEYLKIAQDLEMFGISYFEIKNKKGTELLLGVDARGLSVFERNNKLTPKIGFPWSEIKSISFSEKKFTIKPVDDKSPNFMFYTQRVRTNKKILALCMGNHELYVRRHKVSSHEQTYSNIDNGIGESELPHSSQQAKNVDKDGASAKAAAVIVTTAVTHDVASAAPARSTPPESPATQTNNADETPEKSPEDEIGNDDVTFVRAGDSPQPPAEPVSDQLEHIQTHNNNDTDPRETTARTPSPARSNTDSNTHSETKMDFSDETGTEDGSRSPTSRSPSPPPLPTVGGSADSPRVPSPKPQSPSRDTERGKNEQAGASQATSPQAREPVDSDEVEALDKKKEYTADLHWEPNVHREAEDQRHRAELEREIRLLQNKHEYAKLKELFEELSRQEHRTTWEDQIYERMRAEGMDKYKTLRGIQKGNTRTRVTLFEAL